ncbi:ADP-forming succinate--CoA ligase subunit beta [Pontiella sulfatireligans]|uniref:Succinate--CoA ligase [ADP-forming] subunit beta n=1 Tax=Pontiella sulfatireligans TaxID=2750658 RepID=A0A6C2UN51_9BACT|nr:ADP-forming succinate--CoA ligase subunit beta [Pontiella sulfatireligans]VGO21608.1 Succinate--CoA ligase [ADP-forming] subunit beta [Pontiella sulfatireligans]
MKIHEYQAKELLKGYGIPIQDGVTIEDAAQAEAAVDQVNAELGAEQYVIKAQIHAGGRGKGGGVKFSTSREKALENIQNILGMTLITHQTGAEGRLVKKVMVAEALDIKQEFYAAITLDRAKGMDTFMVSSEGGMEIEEVAKTSPEKIVKEAIVPGFGLRSFQARNLALALGLEGAAAKQAVGMFQKLYKLYRELDCSIVEINPLIVTEQGDLVALDAKINFDDNALYLHKDVAEMRDLDEEDPSEVEAGKFDLNYIKLDGSVGCMVNGAGLAMATMDIIKQVGGSPANFLDVGGGANVETVKNGFRIILSDPNVKAVLINIFGGIVRCDRIANGIIEAVKVLDLNVPVVVRLAGTNAEIAKELLANSDVDLISADSFEDAAIKVVEAAAGN